MTNLSINDQSAKRAKVAPGVSRTVYPSTPKPEFDDWNLDIKKELHTPVPKTISPLKWHLNRFKDGKAH